MESQKIKDIEELQKIAKKIRKEKELPFHKTNSFFGGVFGLVKSGAYLIVISAVCEFVLDIMTTQNQFVTQLRSSVIIEYINKNEFYKVQYNKNYLYLVTCDLYNFSKQIVIKSSKI